MEPLEITLDRSMDLSKDLEFWMTNLPPSLRTQPVINLAIPGSHDSATFGITPSSTIAPDAEPIIQRLKFLGPILTSIMSKWSKTQTYNITQQLQNGMRYFDLRIAKKNDSFWFVHGLYAEEVLNAFEELKRFLETHPNEVVILDCQHFYAFQHDDHNRFMHFLNMLFKHQLLPYTPRMEYISVQFMCERRHQVILIYRSDAARFGQPHFWPSACFPNPWADTVSVSGLFTFLTQQLKLRNKKNGFISQCILTPSSWFVFKHLFSTLKKQCFIPLEQSQFDWISKQQPGSGGLNIIISDFVDFQDDRFAKSVINLNKKLLEEEKLDSLTPIDHNY